MILDEAKVLIKTENLYKSYKVGNETKEAVKDANIRIMRGEFVVIEGLSGMPKNIFFNLLGCLDRPSAGKYYFDYDDTALAKADTLDRIRKNKLGYLFRDFMLVSGMTAAQNIEIPMHGLNISRKEKQERLQRALRSFGIEAISEEKAGFLSDMQKQLVSLARAVVNEPLMIIADEPAANLSSAEEQVLLEHLIRLNSEGTAIMLITGKAADKGLDHCRVITFEAGRITQDKQPHAFSLVRREA
jgi:putative ABC transport system ATP-binding protein